MAERTYTDEQVREILRRAVERGSSSSEGGTELGREELIAAARDVGIGADAVDAAIHELETEGELTEEITTLQRERRQGLVSAFSTWGIVNTGLFGIDWATGGGWWFYWPLGAWGITLLLNLKSHMLANPEHDRKEAKRRVEQRRRRREREQADAQRERERARRKNSGGLEGVIERGVEDLLGAAAQRIAGVRVEDPAEAEATDSTSGTARERARGRRPR